MVEPTKICADCRERKPWTEFWAKTRWEDGTMRQPHAYCKPCHQARTNRWDKRKRETDPRYAQTRGKRSRQLLRADPDRYAVSLAYRCEWARKRYGYRRVLRRPIDVEGETLPSGPFGNWAGEVLARDGVSIIDLARRFAMPDKKLREILNGTRASVELETVERALIADDTCTLRDIYPSIYEEAA